MDYSYITPRNVRQLHDGLLHQALVEYRQAAAILSRNNTEHGTALRAQLIEALSLIQAEVVRRGADQHVAPAERADDPASPLTA